MVQAPLLPTRLKSARAAKGWSQRELGQRLGMCQARLSKIETGDGQPYGGQLYELARALDVTSDWLLGLSDEGGPEAREGPDEEPAAA